MSKNNPYRRFSSLAWDTSSLSKNPVLRSKELSASRKALGRTYSMHILRYWFIYHFLQVESQQRSAPLSVCEVGIDAGQMLHFIRGAAKVEGLSPLPLEKWVGVDCKVKQSMLDKLGYDELREENIETSNAWLSGDYDAIVMLHVLEHLYAPEAAIERIVPHMKPGSVLMGGFPSVPDWCAKIREPQIRANPNANGHVSAFSPKRVRRMAAANGLHVDFLSGAFFLRASGFVLEDQPWWLRFNLAFGAMVPNWPGEIYWVMRKPWKTAKLAA